jgi:hypothetical protein
MKEKIKPKYPVYVISKGRADCCYTANFLIEDKTDFKIVIEPQEQKLYEAIYGSERLLTLPFSNLGLGSIPVRNWCWEDSIKKGFSRHWIIDDNIRWIYRRYKSQRIRCNSNIALRATEDFTDRYTNIGLSGLNYEMFAPDNSRLPPFYLNTHVYSCTLINNDIPYRWRGRYNEDTDLCLQMLSGGLCTVAMNIFLTKKMHTMTVKGGNTDELYKGDGRLRMARSLERVWPQVVTVDRRFKRPQHVIKDAWRKFDTPLIRRTDIDWKKLKKANNYGMVLNQVKPEIKSTDLQKVYADFKEAKK